jgi:two-component system phosphate regulon sensor histidine kinase PhoR
MFSIQARARHWSMAHSTTKRPPKLVRPRLDGAVNGPSVFDLTDVTAEPTDFERIFEQYTAGDDRGVLFLSSRRHVLRMNESGRQMLGFDRELPALIGEVVRDVKVGFAVGDAIHDRRTLIHESYLADPDRILHFNIVPITSREGMTEWVLVTVDDITRLRHLETVRRDFVANVSHELRTPIASINLLVETLENGGINDPAAAGHFLRRIQVETEAMNQLVEELLQLSRLESGRLSLNPEAISIKHVIDGVRSRLAVMAEEKSLSITADIQDQLPCVLADFTALEQVLMNLVHNAIKFTPEGGTVSLRARRRGPSVEIEVADTGIGMDPNEADRIFERFYKVDKGRHRGNGTGLGLAIARHLLELQASKLVVISESGRGSRFSFALPIAEEGNDSPLDQATSLIPTRARAASGPER